ncbi:MAG: helix-turn-helix transcriptional regulator [Dokdonella sp.]|nr:MAG: helix-turn-helix transcriptional regulator [Dokdonella sp.]
MSLPQATRVRMALMAAQYTQSDIARECGVAPNTVSAVVHGRSRSRQIETRIALVTGIDPAELWPQWYGPEAKAKRRRNRMSHAQIAEALRAFVG